MPLGSPACKVAERNIEDRLKALSSEFHQARQAAITGELLDIISGFEADVTFLLLWQVSYMGLPYILVRNSERNTDIPSRLLSSGCLAYKTATCAGL